MIEGNSLAVALTVPTVVACLISAELFVRLVYRIIPEQTTLDIEVHPSGSRMYQEHPTLGYSLVPNQQMTVVLNRNITFTSTTTLRQRAEASRRRLESLRPINCTSTMVGSYVYTTCQ